MVERDRAAPAAYFIEPEDLDRLVGQACQVLERGPGVQVEHAEGRALLEAAGAVRHGDRHRIPESVARAALDAAPKTFAVYDRDGEAALELGRGRVHFDPGSAAIHRLDGSTWTRRHATCADAVDLARLTERLPHYAAQATAVTPGDVPEAIADRVRLHIALRHCRKPVVTGTFLVDGFAPMRDMLVALRGSEERLAESPLAIFDCCPSPPLRWSELTCAALIDCARAAIPVQLVSMPLAGATAPVTLREAVIQHCAESLSGVVLVQQARAGAPVIWGGAAAAFDMRRGLAPMGAVETMMIQVGAAQVGRFLGLPTHGYFSVSDAKLPDYQAGMESAMGVTIAALAGVDLVSGPGLLDFLLTQSFEKLLLDHHGCGMALRLLRGFSDGGDDVISLFDDLAEKGDLLGHAHTRRRWREELTLAKPPIERDSYGDWAARGARSARERAADEVARMLAEGDVALLDDDRRRALDEVIRREARRVGAELPAGVIDEP